MDTHDRDSFVGNCRSDGRRDLQTALGPSSDDELCEDTCKLNGDVALDGSNKLIASVNVRKPIKLSTMSPRTCGHGRLGEIGHIQTAIAANFKHK